MNIGRAVKYSPELPDPIIHRIQSLLNPKKAAQTTLLSKSWRVAWSTRPTIDLDEAEFPTRDHWGYPEIDEFPHFAKKTFRMYKKSNMSIETFKLRLTSQKLYARSGQAIDWTLKALKLGATDLTFEIDHPDIAIPLGAVCGQENVASLCLQSSRIDRMKVLNCPGLKSLTLTDLSITWESFFNVISGCPLIENLSLSDISDNHYYEAEDGTVFGVDNETYDDDDDDDDIDAPPTFFLHNLRSLVLCRISSQFRIKALFSNDLSYKFPNLKDLTLELSSADVAHLRKKGDTQIISSRSLEVLNLTVAKFHECYHEKNDRSMFEFDVPSIQTFKLDCTSFMPKLRFTSASMDQCESRVSLTQPGQLSSLWFLELRKLLTELRGSKIHLCLHLDDSSSLDYYQHEKIKCLNVCELENLTTNTEGFRSGKLSDVLDGFFRICRPKMITQYISPSHDYNHYHDDDDDDEDEDEDEEDDDDEEEDEMYGYGDDDEEEEMHDYGDEEVEEVEMFDDDMFDNDEHVINNDVVLCRELIQGMKARRELLPNQNMYGLRDVEELNVETLLDGLWRPQPLDLDSLLDDSSKRRRFRFRLKWKPL